MRFIHTADWHLGRPFYNAPLIDDQAYVLDQLVDLAHDAKPDVLIISGDVYDRPIPNTDAVRLLDDTLCRLVLGNDIPVILIAGNHDSPLRLQFGARLMESLRLYVFGTIPDHRRFVQMYDSSGPVCFYAMPYAEPAVTREYFGDEQICTHETAAMAWIDRVKHTHPTQARSVAVMHAFVLGAEEESDSERPLAIGGSGAVSARCFDGFDYAALGHLHRTQTLDRGHIHYPGSLLKYSFSDSTDKSVSLVEMDESGKCSIERVPLTHKRGVRCIRGDLETLLQDAPDHAHRDDFIKVELVEKGTSWDPLGRLREVYPNIMALEIAGSAHKVGDLVIRVDHRTMNPMALFADFFKHVTGQDLSDEQAVVFSSVVEKMSNVDREASI